jgi:hypothetical protein
MYYQFIRADLLDDVGGLLYSGGFGYRAITIKHDVHVCSLLPSAFIRQGNPHARFVWCTADALPHAKPQREEW